MLKSIPTDSQFPLLPKCFEMEFGPQKSRVLVPLYPLLYTPLVHLWLLTVFLRKHSTTFKEGLKCLDNLSFGKRYSEFSTHLPNDLRRLCFSKFTILYLYSISICKLTMNIIWWRSWSLQVETCEISRYNYKAKLMQAFDSSSEVLITLINEVIRMIVLCYPHVFFFLNA